MQVIFFTSPNEWGFVEPMLWKVTISILMLVTEIFIRGEKDRGKTNVRSCVTYAPCCALSNTLSLFD